MMVYCHQLRFLSAWVLLFSMLLQVPAFSATGSDCEDGTCEILPSPHAGGAMLQTGVQDGVGASSWKNHERHIQHEPASTTAPPPVPIKQPTTHVPNINDPRSVSRRRRRRRDLCKPPDDWLTTEPPETCLHAGNGGLDKNEYIDDQLRAMRKAVPGGRVILWFGTFLGWYRECGVLTSDHDIDVVIFPDDFNQIDWKAMKYDLGLVPPELQIEDDWRYIPGSQKVDGNVVAKSFLRTASGEVDIWIMHQNETHYLVLHPRLKRTYEFPKMYENQTMSFQPIEFLGEKIYAPHPAEPWLKLMYGANWRKPISHKDAETERVHFTSVVPGFDLKRMASADCSIVWE